MKNKNYTLKLLMIILSLIGTILMAGTIGSASISIIDFFRILLSRVPFLEEWIQQDNLLDSHRIIVMNLRLPRIILALIGGAGLAFAGVIFQGVFSNPMAEPYLLGVSSGAAMGATLAAILNIQIRLIGFGTIGLFAFAGSLLVMFLIFAISKIQGKTSISVLLLIGLAINSFFSALISLIMMFNQDKVEEVYFWTMGSFKNATWEKVIVVGIIVLMISLYSFRYSKELDIIMIGDEQAKSLGIEVDTIKKKLLILASLGSAVIVAASGIIGFVGLIIPHCARLITGEAHKKLMPMSMLIGGIFMIVCDTIARSIIPNKELTTGVITSLFGVPFFIWLIYKNRKTVGL
ncbi:iron complex transport system permease protein [Natranaerovirga hydrolytica]|uniref:Iron complex transport system permease protein n=1 Tax=Natranaerovirga hydrolytica TaxID=680378 RepID=A0A4R1M7U6_9FIRM|nr:iron ABC transporter permease [Natranaerovirga hydrolytica]TCK88005.1 iron complex transport system permease protein [Natranaerovirga hydrolytica]